MNTFPYINGKTYAEIIGKEYYIYQGAYIGTSILVFFFSTIQCYRAWYNTKSQSHIMQKRTLIATCLMSFFFLIQSIDPLGYQNVLPQIIEVLASSFSNFFGLTILFILLNLFTNIFNNDWKETVYWHVMFSFSAIISVIIPFLQVYINRPIFRGIKLILYSLLLTIISIRTDFLIYKAYILKKEVSNENTSNLLIHMIIFNIVMPFIIIVQLVFGILSLINDKLEPNINFEQYTFPICELFVIIFSTSFMSNIKSKSKSKSIKLPPSSKRVKKINSDKYLPDYGEKLENV